MEATQNQSTSKDILILGFQDLHNYRTGILFIILLIIIASIIANLLMIVLVTTTQNLFHSPMYFFLSQLSITDLIISSSVSSTLLPSIWENGTLITMAGCFTQFLMLGLSTYVELFLLTVMSYDRYLAICKPLHYAAIMNISLCLQLTISLWIVGLLVMLTFVIMINNLHFCGPLIIHHFFCEFDPIVQLSCSDTSLLQTSKFIFAIPETTIESLFIITTYICIFRTILRIPSSTGRQKAFSTCSSHLTVVCIYYGTLIAIYVAPSGGHKKNPNMFLSLLYTIVTPLLNPLIYSLKNVEIHTVLRKKIKNLGRCSSFYLFLK